MRGVCSETFCPQTTHSPSGSSLLLGSAPSMDSTASACSSFTRTGFNSSTSTSHHPHYPRVLCGPLGRLAYAGDCRAHREQSIRRPFALRRLLSQCRELKHLPSQRRWNPLRLWPEPVRHVKLNHFALLRATQNCQHNHHLYPSYRHSFPGGC